MRCIIYGAGKRGKDEADAIGRENIIAFVDQDKKKIGTSYNSIPIIDKKELKTIKNIDVCIITPIDGREEIEKDLCNMGVENYLLIRPFDYMLLYDKLSMFFCVLEQYRDKNIGIYGLSAGTILLYEFLLDKMNKAVLLIPDEFDKNKNYNFLIKNYKIIDLNDALGQIDVLIDTTLYPNCLSKIKGYDNVIYRKAQELFENNLTFYNSKIEKYKNVHLDGRCFIVATGPSLRISDLNKLQKNNEICISMNRIYNIFNRTEWRPRYYVIEDAKMIEDLKGEIAELDLPVKFVPSVPVCFWKQDNVRNAIQYQNISLDWNKSMPLFSSKVERCIYGGITVTYACIQIAVYMGFKDIYLLGVDFNYSNNLYDEQNHFPGYQSDKKIRLNIVFPERMEMAYKSARRYAEANGVHIYNVTRGGKLEVFERIEFDTLFNV